MKVYRIVWLVVCLPLAMVGVTGAFVISPSALAILFACFGVLGAVLAVCVVSEYWTRPPRDRIRLVVSGALLGGTAAGALLGFAVLLSAGVFLLAILVLLSSPSAVGAYSNWLNAAPAPSIAEQDKLARACDYASPEYVPVRSGSEFARLTDTQLCQSWCASYMVLHQRPSAVQMIATVAERQRYLDEFERRNASGFAAWLASGGARGSSNPLPYLVGGRMGQLTINWDELTRGQES